MVIYTYFDTYDSPLIYAELLLKNVDLRYPEQPISKFEQVFKTIQTNGDEIKFDEVENLNIEISELDYYKDERVIKVKMSASETI